MDTGRAARCLAAASFGLLLGVSGVAAQDTSLTQEIQQSQRRLEQIREERARLERQLGDMRTQVRDASQELQNVERRLSSTVAILSEVELQSDAASEAIETTSRDLLYSQDRLAESEARLNRRLRDIYKMGPLHTVQVLLGARSFADLLNRYRYLQQIASSDRQLVERVRTLETELMDQNDQLRERMALLGTLRQQRVSEVAELRAVEEEHSRALQQFRSREEQAASRIDELDADAQRLTGLIDELEERRRAFEANRARAGGSAITTEDEGSLDWRSTAISSTASASNANPTGRPYAGTESGSRHRPGRRCGPSEPDKFSTPALSRDTAPSSSCITAGASTRSTCTWRRSASSKAVRFRRARSWERRAVAIRPKDRTWSSRSARRSTVTCHALKILSRG